MDVLILGVVAAVLVVGGEAGARWLPSVDRWLDRLLSGGAVSWRGDRHG